MQRHINETFVRLLIVMFFQIDEKLYATKFIDIQLYSMLFCI